jgi:hypothetical protein
MLLKYNCTRIYHMMDTSFLLYLHLLVVFLLCVQMPSTIIARYFFMIKLLSIFLVY